ncbi:MAG TPA: PilZ domain-containing protein [Vicinamibacteria bacterium]|nr:PilZ domain-containing protein [Vicinamibacteria bacterium]
MNGGKDRRVRARVAVSGDVLGKVHATSPAPVVNLSETGALVEIQCVLRPGTVQTLRLPLGDSGELTLRCRVVRSFIHGFDRADGAETAVRYRAALEFVGLSDEERAALRAHLAADQGHAGGGLELGG